MLSTSAPAATSPGLLTSSLSPLPYYLAFAAGGRANGQYEPIQPDVVSVPAPAAATTKIDAVPAAFSSPIDIPTADKLVQDKDDGHELGSRGKQLSYDASTAAKEHDSHMHDTLQLATAVALAASPPPAVLNESASFGQDSYFVYSRPGAAVQALGVADGVGGWRSQGVDSGVISRAMMDKCRQQVLRWDSSSSSSGTPSVRNDRVPSAAHNSALVPPHLAAGPRTASSNESPFPFSLPARLMGDAYSSIKQEAVVQAGSTTACVLTLTAQRCVPSHTGLETAAHLPQSATSSPNRSAPTSPPSSPLLLATAAEDRHQLSLDDELKREEKDELVGDALVSQPAADDVDVPLSGATSDSDEDGENDKMSEAAGQVREGDAQVADVVMSIASTSTAATRAASLPQKTASAFWSAVGHLIDHSPAAPSTSTTTTTTTATSLAAPGSSATSYGSSPPPSRPPSPSSPPLYLSCASIGDSGFVLLRHGRVIHRSDLQRSGRIVKQLAVIPPHLQGPVHRFCDDRPTDSTLSCHRIQAGDLLLVASDGLLDNLSAAGGAGGGRHVGFVPWARFFLTGGGLEDDNDREAIEAQNRRLEGLVKECEIDWEGRDKDAADKLEASVGAGASADGYVRLLCDRLVKEATQFMTTLDGKPDDVTVLVAQVCKL